MCSHLGQSIRPHRVRLFAGRQKWVTSTYADLDTGTVKGPQEADGIAAPPKASGVCQRTKALRASLGRG